MPFDAANARIRQGLPPGRFGVNDFSVGCPLTDFRKNWLLSDFDYSLPPGRIAQEAAEPRDAARLLVSRASAVEDRLFRDLPSILRPGDLLVLNDTRVFPARLLGHKPTGGRVEIFLLRSLGEPDLWQAMAAANRPVRAGLEVVIAPGFTVTVEARTGPHCRVRLSVADGDPLAAIDRHGRMPLPPYITGSDPNRDRHRYQTVFADKPGAVAAPTAGLHFTPGLLHRLEEAGIGRVTVTLHVGPGTFQPVREEVVNDHVMHGEWCHLPAESAERIRAARAAGGRIVAVGTTAVRVLESGWDETTGRLMPFSGETDLFILPGYRFRMVDLLITNFHLPKSTLLMLVAAFVGKARLDRDYAHAIAAGYRFYSYGDAMVLL